MNQQYPRDLRARFERPDGFDKLPKADGLITRIASARLSDTGIDPGPLLKKAGLSFEQIENRKTRISASCQVKFLALAAQALRDDFLGINLAQQLELREMGLLYYVLASSETIGEALQRASRYCSIANEGITLGYREAEDIVLGIGYVGIPRHLDRQQMEGLIVLLLRMCQHLSGRKMLPTSVRFIHHRDKTAPQLSKLLGDNIAFGAQADELALPKTIKDMRVVSADAYLNGMLVSYCEEALSHRTAARGAARVDVENAIVPLLPHGKASAVEICRALGMSARTLSRRLEAEGMTFAKVLDNLRQDLAVRYLSDVDLSVSTIAWLLGYREVSSFTHAFKRWTGKTPKQARSESSAQAR